MKETITKKDLLALLKQLDKGKRNIDWIKQELGEEVFEYIKENYGTIRNSGFWSNSQDGNHDITFNLKTGTVNHECSIANIESDLLLKNHQYEKDYKLALLNRVEKLLKDEFES